MRDEQLMEMFPNIAGYRKIREEGAEIIDMIQRKEEYLKVGARCPRGWFFYGDPGMGKTRLVKDIAQYVEYPIVEISTSDAIRRKLTIDEDVVCGFEKAKELGKCIVFIDEMDKFAGYKKYKYEVPENLKTQKILLHELDEVKNLDGIIVIATGNNKDYLDEAVLRSGRFDRHVLFSRPNAQDRREIILHFLKDVKLAANVLMEDLVKMTAGRSCAEIECMVNEAKIYLVHKQVDSLELSDFTAALNRIIFNDIPKDNLQDEEQIRLVAYHEVGHALLGYLLQPENVHYVSIIPQGNAAGSVKMNADDDLVKKQEYNVQHLKIALAGMLSVKVMANTMTGGNRSDLDKAMELILKMLDEGFYGFEYVTFSIYKELYSEAKYPSYHAQLREKKLMEILTRTAAEVEETLRKYKPVLAALSEKLMEKRELSNQEIVEIIKGELSSVQ